jgi:tetratricopeptide (TPR) repeat protein
MADKSTLIKEAQKFLAKGQIDKAVGEWEKIVNQYPDGNNFNSIGDLYLKKGDSKKAVISYYKAANYFRQEGFSLKAVALFKKVLNLNPANSAALYALGELSEEKDLTTDAIKYYLATADALTKEGKKNEIFDIYSRVLSLSPSNMPLRIKVAEILLKEGLKRDAAKEYLHVAGICEKKGDLQKSGEYYRKSLDLHPQNKDAMIGLSILHEKAGETEKALNRMKEAAVLFHDHVDVLLRTAELSLLVSDVANAESCISRIKEMEPENERAGKLLGEFYLKQGLKEKAWEEYRVLIESLIDQELFEDSISLLRNFTDIEPIDTHRKLVFLYRKTGEEHRIPEELILLGNALYARGMQHEALQYYNEANELSPDNDYLKERLAELRGEKKTHAADTEMNNQGELEEDWLGAGQVSEKADKTIDEIFKEADIFVRYGLLSEARELLERFVLNEPENAELHRRLKSLYADSEDKESAVTECLILNKLYSRTGDSGLAEEFLNEAYRISPSDPRLAVRQTAPSGPVSMDSKESEDADSQEADKPVFDDYEEELAEADFYSRQGLTHEALKILLKLQKIFPEREEITERLDSLDGSGLLEKPGAPEEFTTAYGSDSPETIAGSGIPPEEVIEGELDPSAYEDFSVNSQESLDEPGISSEEVTPEDFESSGYEEFTISGQDFIEAQEAPEPKLEDDVLEIFQEFKKGLESELEDDDSETHYNLGIAYKQMGLIDDAIKAFQTAGRDKKRFLHASSMLGVCYMEKGLFSLAVDVLRTMLESMEEKNDSYWSIKYDLAEALEKNNNSGEALDLYTQVYGWNAKFRDISEKVSLLKARGAKSGGNDKPQEGKDKTKEKKNRVSYL